MTHKEFPFASGKTVARMYEASGDTAWSNQRVVVEFRDGSRTEISSQASESFGHVEREMPEVEFFEGPPPQPELISLDGFMVVREVGY